MDHPPPPQGALRGLAEVLQTARAAGVRPLDPWHLAATLEMHGWNDAAAESLGYSDLFALAHALHPKVLKELGPLAARCAPPAGSNRLPWAHFIRGVARCTPMLLAVPYTLIPPADLGSAAHFALAMWGSFLLTSGYQQVITNRGQSLMELKQYRLVSDQTLRTLLGGWLVTGPVSALFLAVTDLRTTALFMALTLLWLSVSVLSLLKRQHLFLAVWSAFSGTVLVSRAVPSLSWLTLGGDMFLAVTVLALGMAAVFLVAGGWQIHKLARTQRPPPRRSDLPIQTVLPHLFYGQLLALVTIGDRFLVWAYAVGTPAQAAALQYESGLSWAGLVFALAAGFSEVGLEALSTALYQGSSEVAAARVREYAVSLVRTWIIVQAQLLGAVVAAALGVTVLLRAAERSSGLDFAGPVLTWGFIGGLVGYSLLTGGLFQLGLLLGTSQHWLAVGILAVAATAGLAAGFLPAELWPQFLAIPTPPGHPPGITGFVTGALTLCLLATWAGYRTLMRAPYLLYANT